MLWYFSALCRRLNIKLADIFTSAVNEADVKIISANDQEYAPVSQIITIAQVENLDSALIDLGCMAAQLLKIDKDSPDIHENLVGFTRLYLQAIQSTGLSFAKIVKGNLIKTLGRFSVPNADSLPDFDALFPEEEQLPRQFEIYSPRIGDQQTPRL